MSFSFLLNLVTPSHDGLSDHQQFLVPTFANEDGLDQQQKACIVMSAPRP